MIEVKIKSTFDQSMEPSLIYVAENCESRPLLVGLHTWSFDRFNQESKMLPLAKKNNWNLILPEFRGPNTTDNPNAGNACGSLAAKQDIVDAVNWFIQNYGCDTRKILLLGASGGGHMALLMAAFAPKLWRAVCSFVPITDIKAWYDENPRYREAITACCGDPKDFRTIEEYESRSPISFISEIAKSNTKIYSGKWDRSVPCAQGLKLYNELFLKYPTARVFFEVFDGGHEMILEEAERWLLGQMNRREDSTVTS